MDTSKPLPVSINSSQNLAKMFTFGTGPLLTFLLPCSDRMFLKLSATVDRVIPNYISSSLLAPFQGQDSLGPKTLKLIVLIVLKGLKLCKCSRPIYVNKCY